MRVIATARGFDNQKLREVDEEFDVKDGTKGSWFKPVEKQRRGREAPTADEKTADANPLA